MDAKKFFNKIKAGLYHEVQVALEDGFDVNTQNEDGNTALHIGTSNYDEELVKVIMPFDPDMKIENKWGYSVTSLLKDNNSMRDILKIINKGMKALIKKKKLGKYADLLGDI